VSDQRPPEPAPAPPAIAPLGAGLVEDGFDYATVDAATAEALRQAAERIAERTRDHIIATGRDLIAARAKLPHGEFGRWALAAVGMSERTVRNYVAAAELVDALPPPEAATVAGLPPATLYALASPAVPPAAREALVRRAMDGAAPSKEEVQAAVREARAAREAADPRHQAKLARQQAEAKEARTRAKRREQRWEAERKAQRAREAQRVAAAHALAALMVRYFPAEALPEVKRLAGEAGYGSYDALCFALNSAIHGWGEFAPAAAGPEDAGS
jgi:hypothetical protein